jgi:hypothetical protein
MWLSDFVCQLCAGAPALGARPKAPFRFTRFLSFQITWGICSSLDRQLK